MGLRDALDLQSIIRKAANGTPYSQIAEEAERDLNLTGYHYAVTRNTVAGIIRDFKNGSLDLNRGQYTYTLRSEASDGLPRYDGEMRLTGDWIIAADWHIPFMSFDMLPRLLAVQERFNIQNILIAGDFIDAESQSVFSRLSPPRRSLKQELDTAQFYINLLKDRFSRVVYLRGNHEDRLLKTLNGELDFVTTAKMWAQGAEVTNYDRVFIESGGVKWAVTHQKNYSSANKLKVAEQLAYKYQCNIIITHQHKNAVGTDRYDNYALLSLGGLHDPQLQAYLGLKTSTGPAHDVGFGAIRNGRGELWTNDARLTDWSWV